MKIRFNDTFLEIAPDTTIADFLQTKDLLDKSGMAVAINGRVVPKEKWKGVVFAENDALLIIGATYGG